MKKHPMPPGVAALVIEREGGRCAVCGGHIHAGGQIHHRKPRGMGGAGGHSHSPTNLLYVHGDCHLNRIEKDRTDSLEKGWLVAQSKVPGETPLLYMLTDWVFLYEDGSVYSIARKEEGRVEAMKNHPSSKKERNE